MTSSEQDESDVGTAPDRPRAGAAPDPSTPRSPPDSPRPSVPPAAPPARLRLDLDLDLPALRERTAVVAPAPTGWLLGPRLGAGGMAEIWSAHDPDGHACVIKRVRPELLDDPEVAALFREEARISRLLFHPHIIRALPVGGDDVLAFERIDGPSLRELAKELGPALPVATVIEVARDVASALAYAHRLTDGSGRPLELVHRDVSPENVLLTAEGAKLADFGIARFKGREHETRIGILKGKPRYMAPEQLVGEHVDGRADVYALGCVLEELLDDRIDDAELSALIARMRATDAADRPDAAAVREALDALRASASGPGLAEVLAVRHALADGPATAPDRPADDTAIDLPARSGDGATAILIAPTTPAGAERGDASPGGTGEPTWIGAAPRERLPSDAPIPRWVADDWDETAPERATAPRAAWTEASEDRTPGRSPGPDAGPVAPSWIDDDALTAAGPPASSPRAGAAIVGAPESAKRPVVSPLVRAGHTRVVTSARLVTPDEPRWRPSSTTVAVGAGLLLAAAAAIGWLWLG